MRPVSFGERIRPPVVNLAWHQTVLPFLCRKRGYDVLFLPAANRRVPFAATCPTVGTVHDFSAIHVAEKYGLARMVYIRQVLPFLVRRMTHVITISESTRRDLLEHARVPEERVTVIPLAVDAAVYTPRGKEEAIARIGPKYGIRGAYILYSSRIEHPGKNHARLIRAFDQLKAREGLPHQLVFAGRDWDRADEVHRMAEQAACARDILFTGFVDAADIPYLYNGADAFVFPSLYEGFGLPLLEAMSSGAPVACSNLSSLPEVAGDAALLFDPYDEEAIGEALRRLLTDEALRAGCIRQGLARSRLFTWEATARRTLDVIRAVAVHP
jgi:glycosyltransferase involved in cell wall biosynthesis